jgi:hypothetical protein
LIERATNHFKQAQGRIQGCSLAYDFNASVWAGRVSLINEVSKLAAETLCASLLIGFGR